MRRIDADELKKALDEQMNFEENCRDSVFDIIDNAPTVECPFYAEAYQTGYEEGKNERPEGEWIAVKDKLPDKEGFYLVSLENGRIVVADSGGIIENHDFEPKMVAWQPLPEPYKKEGADMREEAST